MTGDYIIRDAAPADAGGITAVQIDSWRTTYTGIIPEPYICRVAVGRTELFWEERLSSPPSGVVTIVAELSASAEIVGFGDGGPSRSRDLPYDAEVYSLYLLQPHQRKGIGTELLRGVAERLRQSGFRSMFAWVLADNPSCRFYEARGGTAVDLKEDVFEGVPLIEFAYGWSDLDGLLRDERGT